MKKGFTLIELLAVIVIVAIITLIATPIISNVVNNSKVGALKSSAYGLLEASNLYYAQNGSKGIRFDINDNVVTSNDTTKLLNYKGNIKRGTIIIDKKGNTTICITDGTNSAYKNYNDQNVTTVTKETCNIPATSSIVYLENSGATRTELNNQELTDLVTSLQNEITSLKSEITALKSSKANQSDLETISTLANNAATKAQINALTNNLENKTNYLTSNFSNKCVTTSTCSYTAESDGWIRFIFNGNGNFNTNYGYVNNEIVCDSSSSHCMMPIKKGQVATATGTTSYGTYLQFSPN